MHNRLIPAAFLLLLPIVGWGSSEPVYKPDHSDYLLNTQDLLHSEYSKPPTTAKEWYDLAQLQIKQKRYARAHRSLEHALKLNPDYTEAHAQIGYLYLWTGHDEKAYETFNAMFHKKPCDRQASKGLQQVANHWALIKSKRKQALAIYNRLITCNPKNGDVLYLKGRVLTFMGQYQEAKKPLLACLKVSPKYVDAQILLGRIYTWLHQYDKARALLEKHPDNPAAQKALAQLSMAEGKGDEAEKHYRKLLESHPNNHQLRKGLANALSTQMEYSDARDEFAYLVDNDPNLEEHWNNLFANNANTNPSVKITSSYVQAKENDPSLLAPVVKNYYNYNALHATFPVANQWKLDLKPFYYHQRENDIYPPTGVNYSVDIWGGQITSSILLTKGLRWDATVRGLTAGGIENENYPFQNTNRWEPGTTLLYSNPRFLLVLDAHVESFIIKNFDNITSELLRTDFYSVTGKYNMDNVIKPELEVNGNYIRIHDNLKNREVNALVAFRFDFPGLANHFTTEYRFQYGHFHKLNQNYYSYKRQYTQTLAFNVHMLMQKQTLVELIYEHSWQPTYDLFQPIGNDIFIAPKQYLMGDKIIGRTSYRYKDRWQFSLEGHFFRDTLPYRDYGLKGTLLVYF